MGHDFEKTLVNTDTDCMKFVFFKQYQSDIKQKMQF